MKTCSRCTQDKDESEFYRRLPKYGNSLHAHCKPCHADMNRESRNRNRTRYLDAVGDYNRRRTTGVTASQFREMLAAQEGVCAICHQPERSRRNKMLAVDHDHATNEIRALLCSHCNQALGLFQEDAERLRAAADYIEKWRHG